MGGVIIQTGARDSLHAKQDASVVVRRVSDPVTRS